jgi:type I pantothenate kinase
MTASPLVTARQIGELIASRCEPGEVMITGLTGSVACGKSTLAAAIAQALSGELQVQVVSTDGFLLPNAELDARGLTMRKGFPESYDIDRLTRTLDAARSGAVQVPGYSHTRYDVDDALSRSIDRPDILLVEGLGFAPAGDDHRALHALDALIYVDATEEDLEHWFLERFMRLWHEAADRPDSFYARFRSMGEAEARGFARTVVWRGINLPNLQQNIVRARPHADLLVAKQRDHQMRLVRPDLGD